MAIKRTSWLLKITISFFVVLFFGTVAASVFLFFRLEKPTEPPALVAEPAEYDFGEVGECVQKQTVKLTNRSKKSVEVLHVVKSCSCTEVFLAAEKIPPKKSAEVEFSFDSFGRKGDNGGHFAIAYKSADQEAENSQYVVIRFKAFVDPEITKNARLPLPASP